MNAPSQTGMGSLVRLLATMPTEMVLCVMDHLQPQDLYNLARSHLRLWKVAQPLLRRAAFRNWNSGQVWCLVAWSLLGGKVDPTLDALPRNLESEKRPDEESIETLLWLMSTSWTLRLALQQDFQCIRVLSARFQYILPVLLGLLRLEDMSLILGVATWPYGTPFRRSLIHADDGVVMRAEMKLLEDFVECAVHGQPMPIKIAVALQVMAMDYKDRLPLPLWSSISSSTFTLF